MIHGNRLRTESSTGTVEIIDLDGRRFIHIDTAKKTYTIQTFDQLKAQLAQAQQKMKDEQAKAAAKHGDPQTMTMVPKFDMQATGVSHPVLNLPAKEMKMRMDMLVQVDRPEDGSGSGEVADVDVDDVRRVVWHRAGLRRTARLLQEDGQGIELAAGLDGDGQSADERGRREEFKKNAVKMDGMPLLQYTSFGMAANGQTGRDRLINLRNDAPTVVFE